jgi:hypothetical protein
VSPIFAATAGYRRSKRQYFFRAFHAGDKDGSVCRADSVSGSPALVPAAIEAVKQWKYQPYLMGGEQIEVETSVAISFRL